MPIKNYTMDVFDLPPVPQDPVTVISWLRSRTSWADSIDFCDAANATPRLQAWFRGMTQVFPPRSTVWLSSDPVSMAWLADYTIGPDRIHADFQAGKTPIAFERAFRLAARHGLGLHTAGHPEGIWLPAQPGALKALDAGGQTGNSQRPALLGRSAQAALTLLNRLLGRRR
jgi:hypothetical protein